MLFGISHKNSRSTMSTKPNTNCNIKITQPDINKKAIFRAPILMNEYNNYKSSIESTIKSTYNKSFIDKIKLSGIIICETIKVSGKYMVGCSFKYYIAISITDGYFAVHTFHDITYIFHHEMMYHMLARGLFSLIDKKEMIKYNYEDVKYVGKTYLDYDRHPNFISKCARKNMREDICETYAYIMMTTTNWKRPIKLNKILLAKISIILNALKIYDSTFIKISEEFYIKTHKIQG